jgi:hypothetical protein
MTPFEATRVSLRPGVLLGRAAWALLFLLLPASLLPVSARAEEVCHAQYQSGPWVWYAVETHQRVSTTVASGCSAATGAQPEVLFFLRGSREVIACDLALGLPPAMKAELNAAQLQGTTELPSRRPTLAATWRRLVRKYSSALTCATGFRRMSDASSGVPSVWCRRELRASELCPRGTTFAAGACSSTACPAGMVDLQDLTGGKLSGCSRCPVGRLDVEESMAWRDQSPWASMGRGPVTAILCKARAVDPCPEPAEPRPAQSETRPGGGS